MIYSGANILAKPGSQNSTVIETPTMPTVIVIAGPSGIGKTTIAHLLQTGLNKRYNLPKDFEIPFVEGDDFHSKENIEKMKSGMPLTMDDRTAWLKHLGSYLANVITEHNRRDQELNATQVFPESLVGTPREVPDGQAEYESKLADSVNQLLVENDTIQEIDGDNTERGDQFTDSQLNVPSPGVTDQFKQSNSDSLSSAPISGDNTNDSKVFDRLDKLSTKSRLEKTKKSLLNNYIESTMEIADNGTPKSHSTEFSPKAACGDQYNCVVCTCSALTKHLRKQLHSVIHARSKDIRVVYLFIYPDDKGPNEERELNDDGSLAQPTANFVKIRMNLRAKETGHFMGSQMLQSQLDLMELPSKHERALPYGESLTKKYVAKDFALTPETTPEQMVKDMVQYLELKFLL